MDYHNLKRKELQALCKKHSIPANSANSVLADKLSALLNEKQKPITKQRTCMKSTIETLEEGEPPSPKRQKKKVRFSRSNDLVEYTLRSGEKQKDRVTQIKTRRKSVANKGEKPAVNITTRELVDDAAHVLVKPTRSRAKSLEKNVVPINETKQSRREVKDVKKETDADKEIVGNVRKVTRSNAHTLKLDDDAQHDENRQSKRLNKDAGKTSQSVVETVVSRARVTRSKAQNLMDGGTIPDVNLLIKKKSGKQLETGGQNVEPYKGNIDTTVRATRSRRQTQKEDVGHAVTDLPAVKKRTRKEMKATDLSSKKEPPKRKSLRTRGVETVDEDEGDKVEVVRIGRVTRSKATLEIEASRRNTRSKATKLEVQQLEEPSKNAIKKNVIRRKSVLQPEKTEAVLQHEEPVNCAARKNTRRKSVMQKVTPMVESPSVGKGQPKGQSSNLSVVNSSENKENVIRLVKDASENKYEDKTTLSPKYRKRKGTPITEDHIIETEYKSPKISTRSARKSEEKPVEKTQVESSVKKSVSRRNNQSSVEIASKGKSSAVMRDSSSKMRAKLSGTKRSDSEDHDVNISKEGTPVANTGNFVESSSKKKAKASGSKILQSDSKDVGTNSSKTGTPVASMRKLKIDDELTEAEVTPAIGKSGRRFTRSAIKSERKEPSQSAIKEQQITDTRLTSPKAAKFRPDSAINTAPGRITRSGIKHGGNAAGGFSEKVVKMKHTSQSAHKKQSLDDARIASPEVPEVGPSSDVGSKGVPFELQQSLDEVQVSPLEVLEEGPNTDDKISSPEVAEDVDAIPAEVSDGSRVQNQNEEAYVESGIFSDAVNLETSVVPECEGSDAKEKKIELTESGSNSKGLQTDVMIDKPLVSVGKAVVIEESVNISSQGVSTKGNNGDDDNNCDSISCDVGFSAVCYAPIQQSDVADYVERNDEDESASAQKPLMYEPVSDDRFVADEVVGSSAVCYAPIQQSDVADHVERNDEDESASAQEPLMFEPFFYDRSVADEVVAQEMDIPIFGKSEGEDGSVDAAKESEMDPSSACNMSQDPVFSGSDGEDDLVTTNEKHGSNPRSSPDIDAYKASPLGKDEFSITRQPEPSLEPSSADDIIGTNATSSASYFDCDNAIFDRKSRVDKFGTALIGNDYATDDGSNDPKDPQTGLELSNAKQTFDNDDDIDAQDGESEHDQSPCDDNPEEDVGGDMRVVDEAQVRSCDQEPKQILKVNVHDNMYGMIGQSDSGTTKDTPTTVATSGNVDIVVRVDALEELAFDINKDLVSGILGDSYDMDANDDLVNEQMLTESDEGFQLKEGGVSSITKDSFANTYTPVDDTDQDLSIIQEDDRNNQEETQNAGISVDWGDCDIEMVEYEKPISPDGNADVVGKDYQYLDLQNSARTLSSMEESSGLASGSSNSVRNLEKSFKNLADGKSNQDSDMLKENAMATDVTQEGFNWPDMSLKSLFATPTTKDSQEDAVDIANQDTYETQDTTVSNSKNETNVVQNFQYDPLNLFGEEEVGGGSIERSGRNTPSEFKGDQIGEIKQFEFLSEAAGTSHLDLSNCKDKSTQS